MLTLERISQAFRNAKSGTDFPAYIPVIKSQKIRLDKPHDSARHTTSFGDSIVFNGTDTLRW